MKKILNKVESNKLLLTFLVVLQIVIIILILNPFALIADSTQKNIISEAVNLAGDPDFRNASIIQISDADAFKKQYLLNEKYSDLKNEDYILLVNGKMLIYRKSEQKIIYNGDASASLLDQTRLINLISLEAKNQQLIKEDEQLALKIFNEEDEKDFYNDYFQNLKNGDVLAFFPKNKIVVLYNLQSQRIESFKKFSISE